MPRAVAKQEQTPVNIQISQPAPPPPPQVEEKSEEKTPRWFFDKIEEYPKNDWGRVWSLELYRLKPDVPGVPGSKGYLALFNEPITLEQIKATYGGGLFRLNLCKNGRWITSHEFPIAGEPKYDLSRERPSATNGNGSPSSAESKLLTMLEEQIGRLNDELLAMRSKGEQPNPAMERGLDILTTAYKRGIETQGPPADSLKSIETAVALIEKIRPAAPTAGGGILETISVLKELGVFQKPKTLAEQLAELASLRELMGDAGGGGKTTWLDLARDAVPRVLDTISAAAANQQMQQRPRSVPPQRAPAPAPAQQLPPGAPPSSASGSPRTFSVNGLRMVPVDDTGEIQDQQPVNPLTGVNVAAEEPHSVVMRKKIVETIHFGEDAENDATDIVNYLQIAWPEGARYLETLSEEQITKFFAMDPILVVATQEPRWREVLMYAKKYALELLADAGPEPPTPKPRPN